MLFKSPLPSDQTHGGSRVAIQASSRVSDKRSRHLFVKRILPSVSVAIVIVAVLAGIVVLPRLVAVAAQVPNMDCTLRIPSNPLSAQGLATPYQLSATRASKGSCHEANLAQSAFVQAAILDPASGNISAYEPLVIDRGTKPAVQPVLPQLPANAVVGIWFGFNGNNLTLVTADGDMQGTTSQSGDAGSTSSSGNADTRSSSGNGSLGSCVNGIDGSIFGQFSYCNASAFFVAANAAIKAGMLKPPALQTAKDGMTCPTTRDFSVVDQDQSDNVQTAYLVTSDGKTAQDNAANLARFPRAKAVGNPSDNGLLTRFIDPALGCQPWMVPDLSNNGALVATLAADELQAAANQQVPVALVPLTDPMTLNNNDQSLKKTNLYRLGVDQPMAATAQDASGKTYCQQLAKTGLPRLVKDKQLTIHAPTPDAQAANSLFMFLAQRFNASYTNLNCQKLLKAPNPVTIKLDKKGIAVTAEFKGQEEGRT